jgi:hypothetical protein
MISFGKKAYEDWKADLTQKLDAAFYAGDSCLIDAVNMVLAIAPMATSEPAKSRVEENMALLASLDNVDHNELVDFLRKKNH